MLKKRFFRSALLLAGIMALGLNSGCQLFQESQEKHILSKADTFRTSMDSVSYILGTNVYQNFNQEDFGINDTMVLRGLSDAIQGHDTFISEPQKQQVMKAFQQRMQTERSRGQKRRKQGTKKARKRQARENLRESKAFLRENKKKPDVTTTPSGLQYEITKPGTGPSPGPSDTVKVHYKGMLKDSTVFDNSYKRGRPAEFPVNGVIKGWQEGLQLMNAGAQYRLYIPPELAYGKRGAGAKIGPNEVLIFKVELLAVQ